MCELLGVSSRFPTTVRLSLDELARHGGGTGPHRDGWGIGFWQDGDALVIREPGSANESRRFRRIGETDSEQAFCALLARLERLWKDGLPELEDRLREVRVFASELRTLGPANFLYTDGDVVFAHGHRRKHDGADIRPPGLHVLCKSCTAASDAVPWIGLSIDPEERQEVALVASVPLSTEAWEPLAEGEIVVLREGRMIARSRPDRIGRLASADAPALC